MNIKKTPREEPNKNILIVTAKIELKQFFKEKFHFFQSKKIV
jgi:hypothetical protein